MHAIRAPRHRGRLVKLNSLIGFAWEMNSSTTRAMWTSVQDGFGSKQYKHFHSVHVCEYKIYTELENVCTYIMQTMSKTHQSSRRS